MKFRRGTSAPAYQLAPCSWLMGFIVVLLLGIAVVAFALAARLFKFE